MTMLTNPESALQGMVGLTVKDAIYSNTPSIFKLSLFSKQKAEDLLMILIDDVVSFLNVGKTMDAPQAIETCKLILSDPETKNLKPEDFKICFNNAKKGIYGKQYDRVDGQVIFEWLRDYMAERMDLHESLAMLKHNLKEDYNDNLPPNPEGQKKVIETLKKVIDKPSTENVKTNRVKSERDAFIQKCFLDHYQLWLKKPYKPKIEPSKENGVITNNNPLSGSRYILIDVNGISKPVDELEYTEIKLKEWDLLKANQI